MWTRKIVLALCLARLCLAVTGVASHTIDQMGANATLRMMRAVLGGYRNGRATNLDVGWSAPTCSVKGNGQIERQVAVG